MATKKIDIVVSRENWWRELEQNRTIPSEVSRLLMALVSIAITGSTGTISLTATPTLIRLVREYLTGNVEITTSSLVSFYWSICLYQPDDVERGRFFFTLIPRWLGGTLRRLDEMRIPLDEAWFARITQAAVSARSEFESYEEGRDFIRAQAQKVGYPTPIDDYHAMSLLLAFYRDWARLGGNPMNVRVIWNHNEVGARQCEIGTSPIRVIEIDFQGLNPFVVVHTAASIRENEPGQVIKLPRMTDINHLSITVVK